MDNSSKCYNEDRRLFLQFIQNNIVRMNRSSFQIKGMMVTILTALIAAFVAVPIRGKGVNVLFLFVAIVPSFIFWVLDSYYLQQERKLRGIYSDYLNGKMIKKYSFPLNKYKNGKYSLFKIMFSRTEWPMYLVIILGLTIAGVAIIIGGK